MDVLSGYSLERMAGRQKARRLLQLEGSSGNICMAIYSYQAFRHPFAGEMAHAALSHSLHLSSFFLNQESGFAAFLPSPEDAEKTCT